MSGEEDLVKTPYYSPWFSARIRNSDFGKK